MIFSVNNRIVFYNSGIEHAEFKRTQLFHEHHQPAKILEDNWDPNNHYYMARVGIPDRDVIDMYDYFQHSRFVKPRKMRIKDLSSYKKGTVKTGNGYQAIHHGQSVDYVYFFQQYGHRDCVRQVDRFYDNQCYCSDYYDFRGFLSRRMLFSSVTHQETEEQFFTPSGKLVIRKVMQKDPNNHNYYAHYHVWGSRHSLVGRDQLILHFLNLICLQYGSLQHPVILIADRWWRNRTVDNLLDAIKYPHYMVFYAHYSHVMDDKKPMTSKTDVRFDHILKQAHGTSPNDSYDALICSTPRQSHDIKRRYQPARRIFTIPVGIQDRRGVKHRLPMNQRLPWQINCVTRVDPVEGILDTIKAFCLAHQKLPKLKLDIYGKMGAYKPKFKKQLTGLKRKYHLNDDNFAIHKYTCQVPDIYRQSRLTLVTSKSDVFNISLLEALSQGCPAIVYNDNYGPRDMIKSGFDGYQVDNDYRVMAKRIVYLFKHPELMQKMSKHAYQVSNRYSPDQIWRKWQQVIKSARRAWPDKLLRN